MEEFVKIAVTGGELLYNSNEISKVVRKFEFLNKINILMLKNYLILEKPLEIIILTVAKNIYLWYDDLQQFVK